MPTVTFNTRLWNAVTTATGLPADSRGNQDYVREAVQERILREQFTKNGHIESSNVKPKIEQPAPRAATSNFFGSNGTPHYTDKRDFWPLSPEVESFARYINLTPDQLKPDHELDQDDEFKHIEEKKFWIRAGYRFEGMSDPETAADHVVGDILRNRPFSELPEKAVAANNAMRGKFRNWWRDRNKK
jgi:hypothetical protein